jgi:hypothetical protein
VNSQAFVVFQALQRYSQLPGKYLIYYQWMMGKGSGSKHAGEFNRCNRRWPKQVGLAAKSEVNHVR